MATFNIKEGKGKSVGEFVMGCYLGTTAIRKRVSLKTESLTCQFKNSFPVQIHYCHRWVKSAVNTGVSMLCVCQSLEVAVCMENGIPGRELLSSQPL